MSEVATAEGVSNGFHSLVSNADLGKVSVVLGAQWGDEGKGKIVDMLAQGMDTVARCQGGNNAGHTVVVGEKCYDFHLLPSGIIQPDSTAVIGNGVVIHLPGLFQELEKNKIMDTPGWEQRLIISDRAQIVTDFHQKVDGLQEMREDGAKIGTTKKGIGPAYSTKYWRSGIRMCDLIGDFSEFEKRLRSLYGQFQRQFNDLSDEDLDREIATFKDYAKTLQSLGIVKDTATFLRKQLASKKKILVEGANGALLDIDFGTYPYVTSSNCSVGGACTGLGIPPRCIGNVIGIVKAYQTRVGSGPFPTELEDEMGVKLRDVGREYGVTTGRPRRCGWLDLVALTYSNVINGFTWFALTKIDVLDTFSEVKLCVSYKLDGKKIDTIPAYIKDVERLEPEYVTLPGWQADTTGVRKMEDLPLNARNFIYYIEKIVGVPVRWIGIGKDRSAMVDRGADVTIQASA